MFAIILNSPGQNRFLSRQFVLVSHPIEGFSCLPSLQPGSWRGKEGAGAALIPSVDEFPGEGKYAVHKKKMCNSCLIVCLVMGLSRVEAGTNPCHADLFPLFLVAWLSLGNSYLVGSLERLDELLNSSLSSFLSRLPQIISELYYFYTHTAFKSTQMTLFVLKMHYTLLRPLQLVEHQWRK